jgi:hypothetical protein
MARNKRIPLLLGLLGGGGAAFSPLTIPGLALWLDASDASTLFQDDAGTTPATADGDVVGYWGDKSGNGKHVTQTVAGQKPLLKTAVQNGRNGIKFDGSDDVLANASFALTKPDTLIAAIRTGTGGGAAVDGVATRQGVFHDSTTTIKLFAGSSVTVGTASNTTAFICVGVFNGAASYGRVNAVQSATVNPGTNDMAGIRVGNNPSGSFPYNGHVLEVIAAQGELSAGVIASVEAYLNAKWVVF